MDYEEVFGLAADAVGVPGERTFLLQFTGPWGRHTYLLEKGQVAALAAGTYELERQLGESSSNPSEMAPVLIDEVPRFRIGQLALGYDEADGKVVLTIESVSEGDERVSYRMSIGVIMAAARQGEAAVGGGRPRCPKCGLAMDPSGHACPTTNGDLRHHQP